MATYSNTPNVSGAIAASGSGSGTLYTCPANSYAVIQAKATLSVEQLLIGGVVACFSNTTNEEFLGLYVGPGQSVAISTGDWTISGVQFTNGL